MDPEPIPDSQPVADSEGLPPESPGCFGPLVLAVLIFAVYLFISTRSTIWDRDEARFARATAEMVNSSPSNYLYATFNGKLRPDKPVGIYWLMSVPVSMFGHTEWAYRLCSVIATTLTCLFTYLIARWLFTHRAGMWAMALLAVTPLVTVTGAVATSDAVLLASIAGAFAIFAHSLKFGLRVQHIIALTLFFAVGMLVKGPVALIPVIPFVLTRYLLRDESPRPLVGNVLIVASVLAACGIFAAWFIPANNATKGELYEMSFKHHVLKRATEPLEGHGGYSPFSLFGFYPLIILAAFFPWTLYLPGAVAQMLHNDSGGRRGKIFLLTWILTFLLTMIVVSTKLPHYILPIWPALALSVGAFLDAAGREEPRTYSGWWTFLGGLFFVLGVVALGGGLGFGPEAKAYLEAEKHSGADVFWNSFAQESRTPRMVLAALLGMVSLTLIFRHQVANFAANARILVVCAFLFLIFTGFLLLPAFEPIKITPKLVKMIRDGSNENAPVTLVGYDEASLFYYLDKRPASVIVSANTDYIVDWVNVRGKAAVLVMQRARYDQIRADKGMPGHLYHMGDVTGYNYSKDHWMDLIVIRRNE